MNPVEERISGPMLWASGRMNSERLEREDRDFLRDSREAITRLRGKLDELREMLMFEKLVLDGTHLQDQEPGQS